MVAFVVAIAGLAIESAFGCSNAFSRSGSLIVCVGIIFGAFDIRSVYERNFGNISRNLDANRLENDIVFSDDELEAEIRGSTNYFRKSELALKETGQKRVVFIDASVLIVGTLIWGFGDLILQTKCA